MPTSLTGLLIFVALLAPGFVYLLVTELGPFARSSSTVLRETASISLVSLLCDLFALGGYAGCAAVSDGRLASLQTLIEDGEGRWAVHRVSMLLTGLSLLLGACLIALALAALVNHTSGFDALMKRRPIRWVIPPAGARTVSAWWEALRHEHPDRYRRVTCYMLDGTRLRGGLKSFNPSANETEDRELILAGPLRITTPKGERRWLETGYMIVSARQLQYLHVDYFVSPPPGPRESRGFDRAAGVEELAAGVDRA